MRRKNTTIENGTSGSSVSTLKPTPITSRAEITLLIGILARLVSILLLVQLVGARPRPEARVRMMVMSFEGARISPNRARPCDLIGQTVKVYG